MGKVFGLLGHPVGHSMSPNIHNDAFGHIGIDATYHAFDVDPNFIKDAIAGLKALQISGCNVTVPHKIAVMEYLDEIDEEARLIGAVNTIVNVNGRLVGYNTDGRGFVESLEEEAQIDLQTKRFLIIGAGGAARGIVTSLLRKGIGHLTITNRTAEKATPLLKLAKEFKTQAEVIEKKQAENQLSHYDVIINTTSIGMSPNVEYTPLSLEQLTDKSIVCDLIYNPLDTAFLIEAKKKGCLTINGVGMFVNQAALSFEHWTGKKPERERMRKIVLTNLGGTSC
ncbi:shikimate 5-dehydrogenase I alpha [Halalkalibacter wakoensis JCM 9140]|uniref:Shikimate dehydrogenase (NADP(+)) n=1 Tax=Halalkalibacter wakoensis JCM 9140 TaxID=1236970 RepID=W4Q515_9BACI|nr:shikimate dehydrogenase [Halalkalibacter wakoensis]GAE27092.1 shikimate 5-dehydrogenase I alpha [Halalkalibacter wakoensis JCM 9140]